MTTSTAQPISTALQADPAELDSFTRAIFARCTGGHVVLRSFQGARAVTHGSALINQPAQVATLAASYATAAATTIDPSTFAPPPCTFRNPGDTTEAGIENAPALVADLDNGNPTECLTKLERILGQQPS